MKIILAADHGGWELKQKIKAYLGGKSFEIVDMGAEKYDALDNFPDYVLPAVARIRADKSAVGIFACRTGTGPAILANRHTGIRAAVCPRIEYARLAREHQDANVLCLGADYTDLEDIKRIIDTFLGTKFEGGRHIKRIEAFDRLDASRG
jgi:ribose 5-phosphate isomerase B